MNLSSYLITLTISFIVVSVIILLLMTLLTTKIETFAVDLMAIDSSKEDDILSSVQPYIYFKFNSGDLSGNFFSPSPISVYNQSKFINNNCSLNTKDYIKGNASLSFGENTYLQLNTRDYNLNSNNFSIMFFAKIIYKSGISTLLSHTLKNPTMGYMIIVENKDIKVVIGTNENNNWETVLTYPLWTDKDDTSLAEWYYITITYDNVRNNKWILYINGQEAKKSEGQNNRILYSIPNTIISTIIDGNFADRQPTPNMHNLLLGASNNSESTEPINVSALKTNFQFFRINISGSGSSESPIFINNNEEFYIRFISGTRQIQIPKNCTVDILIVGGGGGGGHHRHGGGGGAGGLIYLQNFNIGTGTYSVVVGNGGVAGTNGQNSSFSTYIAYGGGHGGSWDTGRGRNGGSGGGGGGYGNESGGTGVAGQGNNGGFVTNNSTYKHGGGGGAGGPGVSGINTKSGAGGIGLQINITGKPVYYAGGGGGGSHNSDNWSFPTTPAMVSVGGLGGGGAGGIPQKISNGENGTPNTGGGGGGPSVYNGGGSYGGTGGSGVVIIKFKTSDFVPSMADRYAFKSNPIVNPVNFMSPGSLIDDLRIYSTTLSTDQINTLYLGTPTGSSLPPPTAAAEKTDCNGNDINITKDTLIAVPSADDMISDISDISVVINNRQYSQCRQTFKARNQIYELLFSEVIGTTRKTYCPVKLFDKYSNILNDFVNYAGFFSSRFAKNNCCNYNDDGTYGLDLTVPDCGNIVFKGSTPRPKGDYVYIKTPEPFALKRYAIRGISGFLNRAPKSWSLYVYNPITTNTATFSFPPTTVEAGQQPLVLSYNNYCATNNNTFIVDMSYPKDAKNKEITVSSNEYLFVFHSILGGNPNDKFKILAFEELQLYKIAPDAI